MEYRTLGRTGVRVSTYALGTMMFGTDGKAKKEECDVCNAAGRFVDEADRGRTMPWMAPEARRRPQSEPVA